MILDADRLSQWQIRQNRWRDAKPPDSTSTGSTEKAVIVWEAQDGNLVADRSICIRPVVDAATPWATERIVSTGPLGVLEIESTAPGLTCHLRATRFEGVSRMLPEGGGAGYAEPVGSRLSDTYP